MTQVISIEQAEKILNKMMDNCFDLSKECAHARFEAFPAENKAAEIIGDAADKIWHLGFRAFSGTLNEQEFDAKFKEIDNTATDKLKAAGYDENNVFVKKLKAALAVSV